MMFKTGAIRTSWLLAQLARTAEAWTFTARHYARRVAS